MSKNHKLVQIPGTTQWMKKKRVQKDRIKDKIFLDEFAEQIRDELKQEFSLERRNIINELNNCLNTMRERAKKHSMEHVSNPNEPELYSEATTSCNKYKGAETLFNIACSLLGSTSHAICNQENRKR